MTNEQIDLIIKALGAVSWPVTFIYLASWFKTPIEQKIGHITNIKHGETEITALQASQSAASVKLLESRSDKTTPPNLSLGVLGMRVKADIEKVLESKPENEKLPHLVTMAVNTSITVMFNRVYYLIFGSQLQLLDSLSGNSAGVGKDVAKREFFDPAAAKQPEFYGKPDAFEQWLKFLTDMELLSATGELIVITQIGKEFLVYLIANNLTKNKAM
jgi:hypothetical protein